MASRNNRYSRGMRDMVGKRVFLASPGDVELERATVRDTVTKFNDTFAWDRGVTFFSRGWEQTSSGIGRPQERINEEILRDCDYLILILGSRWGSPPQRGEGYESGTEEEFARSLQLLADPDAPMRNVFVGFRGVLPAQARDEQLGRVLEFKDQLERGRDITFKVFDTQDRLSEYLLANLHGWAIDNGEKLAVSITLPPRETLPPVDSEAPAVDLIALAMAMVQEKRFTQAEELFNVAIETRHPKAILEYARFLRRGGRFDSALELDRSVLQILAGSHQEADAVFRARALANIGIIQRKQGRPEDSVRTFNEALREFETASDEQDLTAYIRDNLALSFGQLGQSDRAADELRLSREVREASGRPVPANAFVNEARAQLRLKNRNVALELVDQAMALVDAGQSPELSVQANALDVRRRAHFENQDYEAAAEAAKACMNINQELGNADGIGIAEVGLALALIGAGRVEEAGVQARSSLDRNLRSGNATGQASALWALAQAESAARERTKSKELAATALVVAEDARNTPLANAIRRWIESQSADQVVVD